MGVALPTITGVAILVAVVFLVTTIVGSGYEFLSRLAAQQRMKRVMKKKKGLNVAPH